MECPKCKKLAFRTFVAKNIIRRKKQMNKKSGFVVRMVVGFTLRSLGDRIIFTGDER